ncbi:MAG: hypothetical protein LQ339_003563 [Xanthoria mediterranea]|nr:MAG: hypothetical protein LQ339_003563 [Xanthoria mediterranea]
MPLQDITSIVAQREQWDEAVRSGPDPEDENGEDDETVIKEEEEDEEEETLSRYEAEDYRCERHATADFFHCECNLSPPPGSMDGLPDDTIESMQPRLHDLAMADWRASNTCSEERLQRQWSYDSAADPSYRVLPDWAERDPDLQHLVAHRPPSIGRGGHSSVDAEVGSPRYSIGNETVQSLGKRKEREREEDDAMSDSDNDGRRIRARVEAWRTSSVPGASENSAAYLPRPASRSRPIHSNSPGNGRTKAATPRRRLPRPPLLGFAVAPAGPVEQVRGDLATEAIDEEARTPSPLAGAGIGQAAGMDTSLPQQVFNNYTRPLAGSSPLKRNRLVAEEDRLEERSPKRLRGTLVQGDSQQQQPTASHRHVAGRARHTGYPASQWQSLNTEVAGMQSNQAILQYLASPNTRTPNQPADVTSSVPEDVGTQIRAPEARTATGSRKRGRGSQVDEDEAVASVSPAKKPRQTVASAGRATTPADRNDAAMAPSINQGPSVEDAGGVGDDATAQSADEALAGPVAAVQGEPVRGSNRSRGTMQGRVKKNPPAGGKGAGSKRKARANTVVPDWLEPVLANPRQTRSGARRVFVELDAQSRIQKRPGQFEGVMIPATRASRAEQG